MMLHNGFHDCQAKSIAFNFIVPAAAYTIKAVENERQVGSGDAAAGILHLDQKLRVAGFCFERDRPTIGSVFEGIAEQVAPELAKLQRVTAYCSRLFERRKGKFLILDLRCSTPKAKNCSPISMQTSTSLCLTITGTMPSSTCWMMHALRMAQNLAISPGPTSAPSMRSSPPKHKEKPDCLH